LTQFIQEPDASLALIEDLLQECSSLNLLIEGERLIHPGRVRTHLVRWNAA